MKRTLATMGVVGLGLISLTAPAIASSDPVVLAHPGGSAVIPLEFNIKGTGGNGQNNTVMPPVLAQPAGGTNNAGGNGGGGS
ncbi:hypothetical protein ACFFGR_02960, partial [Arthrobacter liuii]